MRAAILSGFAILYLCILFAIALKLYRTREAIRLHRDQRLDDRCWMDDYVLYEILPEGLKGRVDARRLPRKEMLENCTKYVDCRLTYLPPDDALRIYQQWKEMKKC